MKNSYISRISVILMTVMLFANLAMAGTITFTVHGVITDEETKQPLAGVIVTLHDGSAGTVTDEKGRFSIDVVSNDERGLIDFSYVGYEKKTMSVANDGKDIKLTLRISQIMTKEVVVAASRVPERIMETPVTVEKITSQDIQETPAENFYESVGNLKSVDVVTNGIDFKTINIRGFGNTEKPGFVQLIDGADNQSPGLNYSVGYATTDLDVDNVEIVPGASSALYGANAFDGLMNVTTKDPFTYQGLTFEAKTGVNHVDGIDHSPAPFADYQLRYAKAINKHYAFKINLEYFQGVDWIASDTTNISQNKLPGLEGVKDPSYQGLNVYGDEVNAPLPIGPNGSPIVVARTGYNESDLMNYNTSNLKLGFTEIYKFNDKTSLSYTYNSSLMNGILHSADRYDLKDFGNTQQKIEFKTTNFLFRAYENSENSGKSYDTRMLAINMDEAWKNSNQWFTDYATAYLGGAQGVNPGDFTAARNYADIGRPLPGTAAFNTLESQIENTLISNGGAGFDDHTKMYTSEMQYNFSQVKFVDLIAGSSYRVFDLNSNGTLYDDAPGDPITYYEYGAYMQAGKKFFHNKLKLAATLRYDKSENFDGQSSPRFSAVYDLGHDNFLRASYQTGFRMPTSQDQYLDLNVGGNERALGGMPSVVDQYDIVGKVFTIQSVTDYGNAVSDYINAHPTDSMAAYNAVEQYKNKLQPLNYTYVKPEQLQTFEIGYKGIAADSKLFYDLSTYYNINHNFIGYYTVARPQNGSAKNADSIETAAFSLIDPTQTTNYYQLTMNIPGNINTYGVAVSMSYHLPGDFMISGNATYSKLDQAPDVTDGRTLFNTPTYKSNVGFSNKNVFKNIGFALNWRWTDAYLWQSLFGDGMLTAANTLDAQISYHFTKVGTTLKLGATNALDYRHTDVYGGGTVGGMYYVSLRYDGLFDKKN